jgi:hypothetical protein
MRMATLFLAVMLVATGAAAHELKVATLATTIPLSAPLTATTGVAGRVGAKNGSRRCTGVY